MKKLLKEYRFLFIFLAIPYIFIVSSFFINTNKDLLVPSSISEVSDTIRFENYENDNINVVSVYSFENISLMDYLLSFINPYATVNESYKYEVNDLNVHKASGKVQKLTSEYSSIISGFEKAGFKEEIIDENSFKGYIVHTIYNFAPKDIHVGDIITGIKVVGKELGVSFTKLSETNEFEEFTSKLVFEENQEYVISLIRNNEPLEVTVKATMYDKITKEPVLGVYTYSYAVPKEVENHEHKYIIKNSNSLGPSGGLMQSFYVYESLTGSTLSRNLKIAGTGTVDCFGNAGPIGGIYQKVITAHLSGVDVFFVPVSSNDYEIYKNESNYIDALASYKKLKTNMKLVPVSSLSDIIDYLGEYNEKIK